MSELYYKTGYTNGLRGGKYYFWYFEIVDRYGDKVEHVLNDRMTATLKKIDRATDRAVKKCSRAGITAYPAQETT